MFVAHPSMVNVLTQIFCSRSASIACHSSWACASAVHPRVMWKMIGAFHLAFNPTAIITSASLEIIEESSHPPMSTYPAKERCFQFSHVITWPPSRFIDFYCNCVYKIIAYCIGIIFSFIRNSQYAYKLLTQILMDY